MTDNKRPAETVWETASSYMYREAYKILQDNYEAEDAVMDAMCRIIKNEEKFCGLECNEIRALAVIYVRNTAIDIYRRRRNQPYPIDEENSPEQRDEFSLSPEDIIVSNDGAEALYKAICSLPDAMRDVLLLKYHYDYANSEIAEVLGLVNGTVRTRISRARKMLSEKLKGEGIL